MPSFKEFCENLLIKINDKKTEAQKKFLKKFEVDMTLFTSFDNHAFKRTSKIVSFSVEDEQKFRKSLIVGHESNPYQKILMKYLSQLMGKGNPKNDNWKLVKKELFKNESKLPKEEVSLADLDVVNEEIEELEGKAKNVFKFFDHIDNGARFVKMIMDLRKVDDLNKAREFKESLKQRKRSSSFSLRNLLFAETPFDQPQELAKKIEEDMALCHCEINQDNLQEQARVLWIKAIAKFLEGTNFYKKNQWTQRVEALEEKLKEIKSIIEKLINEINKIEAEITERHEALKDLEVSASDEDYREGSKRYSAFLDSTSDLEKKKSWLHQCQKDVTAMEKEKTALSDKLRKLSDPNAGACFQDIIIAFQDFNKKGKKDNAYLESIIDSFMKLAEEKEPALFQKLKENVQKTLIEQFQANQYISKELADEILATVLTPENKQEVSSSERSFS